MPVHVCCNYRCAHSITGLTPELFNNMQNTVKSALIRAGFYGCYDKTESLLMMIEGKVQAL